MNDERTDCSEALLRIYEYLDGEMSPQDCAKIRAHLEECGPCFTQYDVDTTMKALIKRACGCEPAPESLRTTIMSRISMTVIRIEGQG
jgi:mycothiol system anti-sigma-R factor